MKKFFAYVLLAIFAAILVVSVTGCSGADKVSFATLEDARSQARANAEVNARAYARENPRMAGLDVVGHGDSTQTETCPQGDGWASLSIMGENKAMIDTKTGKPVLDKYKVKCSTVSANLGCYLEDDFKKKPFSEQENQCDRTLPFPLPKVVGRK